MKGTGRPHGQPPGRALPTLLLPNPAPVPHCLTIPIRTPWHNPASMLLKLFPGRIVSGSVEPLAAFVTFESRRRSFPWPGAVKSNPNGFLNTTVYVPGNTLLKLYAPLASVVVVATHLPSLRSSTVTPSTPGSEGSWMPLQFMSLQTRLPMVAPGHMGDDGEMQANPCKPF